MVYKTAVNDIDHLKEKIQEAVRSVTADMIAATWRELRKRLVFMIEHNGDHVEAYHHWFLFSYVMMFIKFFYGYKQYHSGVVFSILLSS